VAAGGAVAVLRGSARIIRSTLCANVVSTSNIADLGGGAIAVFSGDLEIERSTLSDNVALRGGAIGFEGSALRLRGNTLVRPTFLPVGALGALLRHTGTDSGATFSLANNLLIGQCSFQSSAIVPGSSYYNFETGGDTCRLQQAPIAQGNQVSLAASAINLGPLADNGGPTDTHLPLTPSIAIDNGYNLLCTTRDQRGFPRVDAECDVGAVEAGAVALPDALFAHGFD
jgi:hypothetical protein